MNTYLIISDVKVVIKFRMNLIIILIPWLHFGRNMGRILLALVQRLRKNGYIVG